VPPEALTDPVYPDPTVPLGRLLVDTAGAGPAIVMLKLLDALRFAESVALTVNVNPPATVGVPESVPLESIDRPSGRLPD
jgi:hypothetical protein